MLVLGIDPGQVNVGWSVVENGMPITGGTVSAKGKRRRKLLTTVLSRMEDVTGRRIPDAVAVEEGNTNPSTTLLVAAARDFSKRYEIPFFTLPPKGYIRAPYRKWSTSHEQDAYRVAAYAERMLAE